MSYTKNLSTKKLSEFTQDDTIYIRNNKDSRKPLLLCKFSSFDGSNYRVTGRIINCKENESYISGGAGILITASYRDCALYGNATEKTVLIFVFLTAR